MNKFIQDASRSYEFGPFRLMPARQSLTRGDAPVRIGGRALDILTALVERRGQVVDKRELMARAWPDLHVEEANLKVNVAGLRRVLSERSAGPQYIATVVGRGYRFIAPVEVSSIEPPRRQTAPAGHNLPSLPTRIVGRDGVIDATTRDLEIARLVSIVGPGGIGKTTVALAVAARATDSLRDGVWLVDLSPLKDPALVPVTIASAAGLTAHHDNMPVALAEFLREKEVLLVLDNCEHLIDAVATCARLILAQAPKVRILATSREPLRLNGERVRRLSGLQVPKPRIALSATEAMAYPAVQLFVDRAVDRLDTFTLGNEDAATVAEICRRLDGLALAIELAATRVDAFDVRSLLAQLDDRFRLLEGHRAGAERHRMLSAALDWSYDLLSEAERRAMRRLSVFAGTFSLESAAAIIGGERGEVAIHIASLVSKSLLQLEASDGPAAYRLLDSTRQYALERLRESGEEDPVRRVHAEHVAEVLERAGRNWAAWPAPRWEEAYGGFLDDLRGALDWAGGAGADPSLLIRLSVAGIVLWNQFSLIEECRARVSRALEETGAAGLGGTAAEMRLQIAFACATIFTRGALPPAMLAMERALETARRIGDIDHQLRCLRMIGGYELFSGNPDGGVGALEAFLALASVADRSAVPSGETHMAVAELFLGHLDAATLRLARVSPQSRPAPRGPWVTRFAYDPDVDVGNVRSHVEWLRGFPDTALGTSDWTMSRARASGHDLSLSNAAAFGCLTNLLAGENEACGACVSVLDELVERCGIVMWRPVVTFCRGALAASDDATLGAGLDLLKLAIEEFRETRHHVRLPYYIASLAAAFLRSGDLAAAERATVEALDLAHIQKEHWILPEVMRIEASVHAAQGRPEAAVPALSEAMALAAETGALSLRLRAATDLATLLNSQGRGRAAKWVLAPVLGSFTEGFGTRDLVRARGILDGLDIA